MVGADHEIQVAVAKHLGLMALRLSDAIVLPLNTTQYALELDNYLDECGAIMKSLNFILTIEFLELKE